MMLVRRGTREKMSLAFLSLNYHIISSREHFSSCNMELLKYCIKRNEMCAINEFSVYKSVLSRFQTIPSFNCPREDNVRKLMGGKKRKRW